MEKENEWGATISHTPERVQFRLYVMVFDEPDGHADAKIKDTVEIVYPPGCTPVIPRIGESYTLDDEAGNMVIYLVDGVNHTIGWDKTDPTLERHIVNVTAFRVPPPDEPASLPNI